MIKPMAWIEQQLYPLQQRFERLPSRDQRALLILLMFIILFIFGGGLWWGQQRAKNAQTEATEQRALLTWMRSQAPYLRQETSVNQPLTARVEQAASQQGLSVNVTGNDTQVQVAVTHENFAVLGSWLSRLATDGISIKQLDIQKNANQQLQLQATLSASR